MKLPAPEEADQQRRHPRGDDAEGGVAEEVEEPLRLGVLEQPVEEEEHCWSRQCPPEVATPVSFSTTRSSRMPRLPFTRTTSPGRSLGPSQSQSGSTSRKCADSTPAGRPGGPGAPRTEEGGERGHLRHPRTQGDVVLLLPRSELQHVAQHGHHPSAGGERAGRVQRRGHRGRVGVVAVVHHRPAARRLGDVEPPGVGPRGLEPLRRTPRGGSPERGGQGEGAGRVQRVVLADEAERHRPAAPRRLDDQGAGRSCRGGSASSSRTSAPGARPKLRWRALGPRALRRHVRVVDVDDRRRAAGQSPANSSPSAAATPSRLPRPSRCSGWMVVMSAASGSATAVSRAISPGWFIPSSTTAATCSGRRRRSVSGTPTSLFRLPSVFSDGPAHGEDGAHHLLGGGLAVAAAHRAEGEPEAPAVKPRQRPERLQRVGHLVERKAGRDLGAGRGRAAPPRRPLRARRRRRGTRGRRSARPGARRRARPGSASGSRWRRLRTPRPT